MRGHAFFLHGNLFDSEESYIKALRLNPALKDFMPINWSLKTDSGKFEF